MVFDFDSVIPRRHTNSLKYDFAASRGKPEDILPMWVADMDFAAPPCVGEALAARARHNVYGYSDADDRYFEAVAGWLASRHGYKAHPSWLIKTPSVVFAIAMAIRALTEKGEAVLIQQPVYYPFASCVDSNARTLVVNPLALKHGRYEIDFEDFEEKIIQNRVRLFIFCSPHNPVGRVWTAEELTRLGDICVRHGVVVVSDEIHMDFAYSGHRHIPFASLKPDYESIAVTCTSPSKTFNLAGLHIANIFIADKAIRDKYRIEIDSAGYSQSNIMGLIACESAYRDGARWLDELLEYLWASIRHVKDWLVERLPGVRLVEPEGTYFLWFDCRRLGLTDEQLDELLIQRAKIWLFAGTVFGRGGEGFQRMNIACPRSVVMEGLERIFTAVQPTIG